MKNQTVNRILALCVIAALFAFGSTAMAAGNGAVMEKDGSLSVLKPGYTPSPNQPLVNEYFNAIFAKYGDFSTWPYAVKAESSRKLAELGADQGDTVFGLPSVADIPEDEAIRMATDAIVTKYLLTDEAMKKFRVGTSFIIEDPSYWSVEFYPVNEADYSEIGTYFCHLSAADGSVITIMTAADAVG